MVKLYPKAQRVLLVVLGSAMTLLCSLGTVQGGAGSRILYTVLTAGALLFTYLGARLGMTVDQHGITERRIGLTRRVPWTRLGEPDVVEQAGNAGNRLYLVTLPLLAGGEVRLAATARFRRKDAEAIRDRVAAFRARTAGSGG
ncbi:hypothetical protein [Kitasatospora sp. NE20-6]|uniref:hypothetical protein n=1 Tax=Kitasatospora sp. NE20-6 TaxID=2859066 RepID=UPI0038B23396